MVVVVDIPEVDIDAVVVVEIARFVFLVVVHVQFGEAAGSVSVLVPAWACVGAALVVQLVLSWVDSVLDVVVVPVPFEHVVAYQVEATRKFAASAHQHTHVDACHALEYVLAVFVPVCAVHVRSEVGYAWVPWAAVFDD